MSLRKARTPPATAPMPAPAAYIYAEAVTTLSESGKSVAQRRRLRVSGIVQGVGFRPFVHRPGARARARRLRSQRRPRCRHRGGRSTGEARSLRGRAGRAGAASGPYRCRRASVIEPLGEHEFAIAPSDREGERTALVPPDVATCDDCLRELFDPADRRYRYPFLNCTQCGPRFTIVRSVPYDRANTTMASFELCADCRREYEDPADRRFHAEPICCPVCGPQALAAAGRGAYALLREGEIVGDQGSRRLPPRLRRGERAGGRTAAGEEAARGEAARGHDRRPRAHWSSSTPEERALLESADATDRARTTPPRSTPSRSPSRRAPPWLGVMLPYTPLHHLLCADFGGRW